MKNGKELEIQMQFLEEATDYLNTLEGLLLEIDNSKRIDLETINAALRSAHSIKGGAAMMGFKDLSNLAHRLEDSFKVLKTRRNSLLIDTHLQSLLLSEVDWLRQIVNFLAAGNTPEDEWLKTFCYPIFDELHANLGDPPPEDVTTMLSREDIQDIVPLLFETEVEEYLQRLESLLINYQQPGLREEIMNMATELGGLGEMLQLPAFIQLCNSIHHYLTTVPERFAEIAELALQAWRRSQALILTNQRQNLPQEINLNSQITSQVTFIESSLAVSSFKEDSDLIPIDLNTAKNGFLTENSLLDYKHNNVHKDKEIYENTVRVSSKQLEQINDLFGEIIIQRNGLNVQLERLRKLLFSLKQRVQTLDQEHQELRTICSKITSGRLNPLSGTIAENSLNSLDEIDNIQSSLVKLVKIDREEIEAADTYSKINLLSQDVMETIVQLAEVTSDIQLNVDDTDQIARKLNKTSKQVQKKLTHVRMRPLSDLLDRFPRAIRDLNVEYGKNVQLKIEGGHTLIERSILEALNEPLMHLLRNAFDHGIEDPSNRREQGKPEQGLIEIKAAHHSDRTIINIRDDGQGISLTKIRQSALDMGLDAGILDNASDEELLSLIFEPGFTTSNKVTTLSGRGVGMDIVQNNLKLIQGDIKVNTQRGIGTTFTLSVPFTLSIARVLLVESDHMLLAFPTDVVAEIFILQDEQVFSLSGSQFLKWQNTVLPLISLARYFEFNCYRQASLNWETAPVINASSVLIFRNDSQSVAVKVDRCWGEQEVAIRQVMGNIPLPNGFSNCTIMGDGRVVPLVNTTELLTWITTNVRPQRNSQTPATRLKTAFLAPLRNQNPIETTPQKGSILIVDDSINVRRYLALTLEKGGYQVEQAKDGQDAWEKLQNGLRIQAVICDIEMPRLDGYGFLERINSNPKLKDIPVAMLTSRSSTKHRQMAMQLGAQAYFSKPYNEQELLRTVEEMIFKTGEYKKN